MENRLRLDLISILEWFNETDKTRFVEAKPIVHKEENKDKTIDIDSGSLILSVINPVD